MTSSIEIAERELQESIEADNELSRLQSLKAQRAEREKNLAELKRRQRLQQKIDTLSNQFQSLKNRYPQQLNSNNVDIEKWIQDGIKLQKSRGFCDALWNKAQELAKAKQELYGAVNSLKSETQQVLMDAGIYPLGRFQVDNRDNEKFLSLLAETLQYFNVQYPPKERPRFLEVGPDGKSYWTS